MKISTLLSAISGYRLTQRGLRRSTPRPAVTSRGLWSLLVPTTLFATTLSACFPEPGDGGADPGEDASGHGGDGGPSTGGSSGAAGEAGEGSGAAAGAGGGGGDGGAAGSAGDSARCEPVQGSERIPARERAMTPAADTGSDEYMLVDELFEKFKNQCQACHVDQEVAFITRRASFPDDFKPLWIERIRSDAASGAGSFMPPANAGGKPFSERSADDAVARLAELLELWDKAGRPRDLFRLKKGTTTEQSPYVLERAVGENLTNIGNCIPERAGFAAADAEMRQLDRAFAKMKTLEDLPDRLGATDLVSFDSRQLSKLGVVAYAPNYPLFSDNSKKLRHVRLPAGTSLHFDAKTQEFEVPDNTRVYKTFLKEVIDETGKPRYRKIETRLIVARRDASDGIAGVRALYGSYVWDAEEKEAVLHRDRLRNAEPFTDLVFSYVLDEPKVARILEDLDPDLDIPAVLKSQGLTRTYALPSSQRCIECHMGSPSKSFLVGVTPLQAMRRLPGQGGTIAKPGADELTQLQRFIDLGVVTGLASTDAVPLEASQGDVKPRNALEERAQGYMLGNCAFCHNPRGFPSQTKPELRPLLDFWPRAAAGKQAGGIFHFPLERYSPRVVRNGTDRVPYITPSLYPRPGDVAKRVVKRRSTGGSQEVDVYAPWRSLLYRNVETPFMYMEDLALYQHMPRNVAGFDCNAPGIFAEWMLSIPAVPLEAKEIQPFVEVTPADPRYAVSVAMGQKRVEAYRTGLRSQDYYCPDTSDIIDPAVVAHPEAPPADHNATPSHPEAATSVDPILVALDNWADNVPDHVHWIASDMTNPVLGDWYPRRGDWKEQLVDGKFRDKDPIVAATLDTLELTQEFRDFARAEVPTTVWTKKPACDFEGTTKVGELSAPPDWVTKSLAHGRIHSDDFVYSQPRGELVFREICAHCHGEHGDSQGLQAQTVLELTGGATHVADYKEGLFGPATDPGKYRKQVFAEAPGGADLWGPRYLAWMALGGTNRVIPALVLQMVATSPVLGAIRVGSGIGVPSANMLSAAENLCRGALADVTNLLFEIERGALSYYPEGSRYPLLLGVNGDAELWVGLCGYHNPAPVRVITPLGDEWKEQTTLILSGGAIYRRDRYPSGAPVGGARGKVEMGVNDANVWPWCVAAPRDAAQRALAEAYLRGVLGDGPLPFCPQEFLDESQSSDASVKDEWQQNLKLWATRGAANAGLAVYSYLDSLLVEQRPPTPNYDRCEDRNQVAR